MGKTKGKRKQNGGFDTFTRFYGEGSAWIPLHPDLFKNSAFSILDPVPQLILLNLLCHVHRTLHRGDKTFRFSWRVCGVQCAENTFRKAMGEMLRIGWIECRAEDQGQSWDGRVYRPSEHWRNYNPTPQETKRLMNEGRIKDARLAGQVTRKSTALQKKAPSMIEGGVPQ